MTRSPTLSLRASASSYHPPSVSSLVSSCRPLAAQFVLEFPCASDIETTLPLRHRLKNSLSSPPPTCIFTQPPESPLKSIGSCNLTRAACRLPNFSPRTAVSYARIPATVHLCRVAFDLSIASAGPVHSRSSRARGKMRRAALPLPHKTAILRCMPAQDSECPKECPWYWVPPGKSGAPLYSEALKLGPVLGARC